MVDKVDYGVCASSNIRKMDDNGPVNFGIPGPIFQAKAMKFCRNVAFNTLLKKTSILLS